MYKLKSLVLAVIGLLCSLRVNAYDLWVGSIFKNQQTNAMKKSAMMLTCLLSTVCSMWAQGFPNISDKETIKWYLIQFTNGGNALTAKTDGVQIETAVATSDASQLWKITGSMTDGYQFTNKEGLTLYVNAASKNEMVYAASSVVGKITSFTITETSNNAFEIHPKDNSNVAMNIWGGPLENRGVGLWNNADRNNPVTFTEVDVEDDFDGSDGDSDGSDGSGGSDGDSDGSDGDSDGSDGDSGNNTYNFEVDGIHYKVISSTENTVEVTSDANHKYSGEIIIPETVKYNNTTYRVLTIGALAFEDCIDITNITISDSVTSIEEQAFKNCSNLTKIIVGSSVSKVSSDVFQGCEKLDTIFNRSDIYFVEVYYKDWPFTNAFFTDACLVVNGYDGQVGGFVFRKGWEDTYILCCYIGKETDLVLPSSYKGNNYTIEYTHKGFEAYTPAIYGGFNSITIPEGDITIGYRAFEGCAIENLFISSSVKIDSDEAFYSCTAKRIFNSSKFRFSSGMGCVCGYGLTDVIVAVNNYDGNLGDFYFAKENDDYKLVSYLGNNTHLVLPANYKGEGYIIDSYYDGVGNMRSYLSTSAFTSITLPDNVTLGTGAFVGCRQLTEITIPNSVTSIGDYAFQDCFGLTSVEIGSSVTSIGYKAFYNCSGLTSVVIPNSVTSIGDVAFSGCSSLTSVEIGNSVTSIGYYAFYDCDNLNRITSLNPTPPTLSESAFYDYDATLYVPTGTKSAYSEAEVWNNFTNIEELVQLLFNVNGIEYRVLSSKDKTVEVISSNTSKYSGDIVIPETVKYDDITYTVTSIGNEAFYDCSGLTSVEIPNSVTSIGEYAFAFCSGLTSVVIPNSVTSIGDNAFYNCSGLTSVVIGNGVTSIGDNAFRYCSGLNSVTSLNPTPPTLSSSTFNMYGATLYVPSGAKTAYSEAIYWKNFTNIEELVYELTDGEEYNEASDKTVNTLTYTRTLPNLHWNALYVPFELPYEVITDRYDVAYINDVNGYDTDGNGTIDDLAMEIITIKGGTLKANYPYLIKAKTEADKAMSITVEDATLYAAEENAVDCSSVYQNYVVKGTYTKKTAEELAGKLAISTSGAWQPLAEGTALNPFRLYLSIENRDNSPLKVEPAAMSRMRIVERGETTGIEEVVPSQQREDVIFDLSGRRVKQPVKGGVYIVNGKKRIL